MITLPANFIDNLISTMGGTISDILPVFLFVAGVFIGFLILERLLFIMENFDNYKK